ncbi:PHO85 cyclin-5 [Gnomoniopsis sp. IMI 355080]|nr:PHO85 cyclin-5 [Gnomoniopsis sp. IMI 355080]
MAIWPNSSPLCAEAARDSSVLPLRTFIQETLRRSRTSYSTLQVALYYLVLIKDKLPASDFTMEQTDDCHSSRALQCGRRMFLAALILASKYLQDRNYSARAWSKISGLNTNEINQNEMAFVVAVNWKLHITEEVYHRWTDCVMKHSPSQPPAPPTSGSLTSKREYDSQLDLFSKQCAYFQRIVRQLNPDLENLEDALERSSYSRVPSLSPRTLSPRSVLAAAHDESGGFPFESTDFESRDRTPTPRILRTPSTMEPAVQSATRILPAFGLLPTPRLTPHTSAIRDLSLPHTAGSAMSIAVSAAGSVQSGMIVDKWPGAVTSSPVNYHTSRRPSFATSVSTVSSPESMISDVSGSSRSSSISSASSLASAPYVRADHSNLEVQARCRSAKQLMNERYVSRATISSIGEDCAITSSPMSYTGALSQEHLSYSAQTARDFEIDDATNDAAQALQALHNNWQASRAARKTATSAPKAGSKRSRPLSIDAGLHDNVRDLLRYECITKPTTSPPSDMQVPALAREGRKRICCSAEAAMPQVPTAGFEGPGMWAGILN